MKNIMKLLLLVVGVIIISCDKSTTEPEARIKTPDEMTWTADTLKPSINTRTFFSIFSKGCMVSML
ncbi:MAG: hypothetical protein M0P71_18160 [Melioribacteraceae bacterium]|nr:hypothetical protein [Melioribacteraceae bacterium]